jgi:hypothetical protein
MKALKAERETALGVKDGTLLRQVRMKIKRVKRRLRRLREAS